MSTDSSRSRTLELLRFAATQLRHTAALAQATGEHFNIFEILRVGHLEVKTHSPILAELLNPKGRHGQGAAFLRLFLARFEVRGFDAEHATVNLESHVGQKNRYVWRQDQFGEAEDTTIWWATWLWWDLYPNWSDEVFAAIQFGVFVDEFKMLLQQLVKVAKQATLI